MPIIKWSKRASKQLIKIDTRYQKTIQTKVNQLVTFPQIEGLDITKLTGYTNQYRLKHGQYRVIFIWIDDTDPQIISIEKVATRSNRTYRPN